jgi:hypothetical protein
MLSVISVMRRRLSLIFNPRLDGQGICGYSPSSYDHPRPLDNKGFFDTILEVVE